MASEKFALGAVVSTPGALEALRAAGQAPAWFLSRHQAGDWGDVGAEDARENERSLRHGWRLLSSYQTNAGATIWVITEADRSSTAILTPDEY